VNWPPLGSRVVVLRASRKEIDPDLDRNRTLDWRIFLDRLGPMFRNAGIIRIGDVKHPGLFVIPRIPEQRTIGPDRWGLDDRD
jgi:hypothetical protein